MLWDNWLDARCKAMISAMIDREIIPLADAIGTNTGKFVVEQRKLREEFGARTDKLRDKLKEFAAENINLREQISQLRTDMTIKAGITSGQILELVASW